MPEAGLEVAGIEHRLARLIARHGPISVAQYVAEANAHYYATRDPFGGNGDFITAPEISQMFGELIGLWLVDLWMRSGAPHDTHYVELGPGRGSLAADALRAMAAAGFTPQSVNLVENSPLLREVQRERIVQAHWHDDISGLPAEGHLLIVANEFFDALPVRQWIAGRTGWHERLVDYRSGAFVPVAGPTVSGAAIPAGLADAPPGTIVESSPASVAIVEELARRIADQGGAVLIIDYGHTQTGTGDTLQAVASHGFADPWSAPGERDLTAHVDFEALAAAVKNQPVRIFGPAGQGAWLRTLGIDIRAGELARNAPERRSEIEQARRRLVDPEQMGNLFKVMALTAPGYPEPAGF